VHVTDDWVLVMERASDHARHYARLHTIFVREDDGRYRRESERHDNTLIDVREVVPPLLEAEGLRVEVGDAFGSETNMEGLMVVVGRRPDR
jgi:hypothetical protein